MPASKRPKYPQMIQFRPGENFGRWIAQAAKTLGVSAAECVRRLAILAACKFTTDHYGKLLELAAFAEGEPDPWEHTCTAMRTLIMERRSRGQKGSEAEILQWAFKEMRAEAQARIESVPHLEPMGPVK